VSEATPNVFRSVPINNEDGWRKVWHITYSMIRDCGHANGGCPSHCDLLVRIHRIANERLAAASLTTPPGQSSEKGAGEK
jgi:hypothetical protein